MLLRTFFQLVRESGMTTSAQKALSGDSCAASSRDPGATAPGGKPAPRPTLLVLLRLSSEDPALLRETPGSPEPAPVSFPHLFLFVNHPNPGPEPGSHRRVAGGPTKAAVRGFIQNRSQGLPPANALNFSASR